MNTNPVLFGRRSRLYSAGAIAGRVAEMPVSHGSAISTIWPALVPEMQNPPGRAARCLEATQGESSLLELHAGGEPR
jgi:hypothetical protein